MNKRHTGITLLELLIGMTLSLLLIGGAFSVYLSNKQTSDARQQLDQRQEALRFASYTLNRIIKNGTTLEPDSTTTELAVAFNRSSASPDCLGNTEVSDVVDRFRFNQDNKTLTCNDQLLLNGIDQLTFSYMSSDSAGKLGAVPAEEATLVKVDITIGALDTSFSATSRASLIKAELAEELVVLPPLDSNPPDASPDNPGAGNGEQPGGDTGTGGSGSGGNTNGDTGTMPPNTGGPAGTGICSCFYKNNPGFTLSSGSAPACSVKCCQDNVSNPKNNQSYSFAAASCQ